MRMPLYLNNKCMHATLRINSERQSWSETAKDGERRPDTHRPIKDRSHRPVKDRTRGQRLMTDEKRSLKRSNNNVHLLVRQTLGEVSEEGASHADVSGSFLISLPQLIVDPRQKPSL